MLETLVETPFVDKFPIDQPPGAVLPIRLPLAVVDEPV